MQKRERTINNHKSNKTDKTSDKNINGEKDKQQ